MSKNEKFIKRNQEHFDKLVKLVDEHGDNIRCLIISSEMSALGELFEEFNFDYKEPYDLAFGEINGKKLVILVNPYAPASLIQVVFKGDNEISFDIPCVCGIYSDEKHP
jgi:hypothetical protein